MVISFNELRINLSKYTKERTGERIYLSNFNKIVGEIKFYTEIEKSKAEIEIAEERMKVSK